MKKLIETLKHIWSIEDLRKRITYTLLLLVIYRLGSFVILPGIDSEALEGLNSQTKNNILGLINTFAGGAFARGAIFALGIMPYISASIFMQLITIAVPAFQRMQKEGEEGRRKINQYTRLLTIAFTAVQAFGYLSTIANNPQNAGALLYNFSDVISKEMFMFTNIVLLTAGTMFTMWLGERITDRGLGNGISLIIMVGIIARMPSALISEVLLRISKGGIIVVIIELVIWFMVIMGVIMLTQGTRKITINYAKRVIGNRQYGGARQYLPIKILAAGVMPIIFAQAIMFIPAAVSGLSKSDSALSLAAMFNDPFGLVYNIVFALLIVIFTYFYTAITVPTNKMADDLKRSGGFIPGVKPGVETGDYLDKIMSLITFPGSLFLALIAVFPAIAVSLLGVQGAWGYFYGGTYLLIMVGVAIDTIQQINSYLLNKHYDGLMKSGKNRKAVA